MTYPEAIEELKAISLKLDEEELDLDQIEALLTRAQELAGHCRNALRRVQTRLEEFGQEPGDLAG